MTIIVQDSFTRADNTTSLGNATETGQTWQALVGSWGVVSGVANQATSTSNAIAVIDSGISDCIVSVKISAVHSTTKFIFRVSNSTNYLVVTTTGLSKVTNGSFASLGTLGYTLVSGDIVSARLEGSLITISVNGTQKLQVTNTYNQTATMHGMSSNNIGAKFDDFSVESLSTGPVTQDGTASIIGTGTLSATATKIQNAVVSMLGTGTLTASPVIIKDGQTSLLGQGLLVANADTLSGVVIIDGSASLLGTGLLTANSLVLREGTALLQGQGILIANADTIHTPTTVDGVFTSLGIGFLTANGEIIPLEWREAPYLAVPMNEAVQATENNWKDPKITVILFN